MILDAGYQQALAQVGDEFRDGLVELIATRDTLSDDSGAHAEWEPLPHQIPPNEDWDVWGMMAGRGAGKTDAGAEYVMKHCREYGRDARVGVGAPTLTDVRMTCFEGPSGILAHARPGEIVEYNRTFLQITLNTGAKIRGIGSEIPNRWRGPNWSLVWADELAAWNEESWHHARFGLRLGPAVAIFTTTPKNRAFIRELMEDEKVAITSATTYDNPHLAARAIRALKARYENTSLGRQELLALIEDSAEGALWDRDMIRRIDSTNHDRLFRIVVAIDPAVSTNKSSAETGIMVVAKTFSGRGLVLADLSGKYSPQGWGQAAVTAYRGWRADAIIGEVNNGGDLVESNIRAVDPHANFRKVHASRGKAKRAEPVVSLYERELVDHVGVHDVLEDQMCLWEPEDPNAMPCDRLDAMVWGMTDLFIEELKAPAVAPVNAGRKTSRWL